MQPLLSEHCPPCDFQVETAAVSSRPCLRSNPGGVSEAGELLVGPARATFQAEFTGRGHRPTATVRVAELGQDAGLTGLADLART